MLVVSVWKQTAGAFLGRLTMSSPDGGIAVVLVTSPDQLVESVRKWVSSLP